MTAHGGELPRRRPALLFLTAAALLAGVAGGVAVAAFVLLSPSLLIVAAEQVPGRPMTRAVALFGAAVALPALLGLWAAGGGVAAGLAVVLDPFLVAKTWSVQAAAWLACEIVPVGIVVLSERFARRDLSRLQQERGALLQEWRLDG